jgi:hypothetical protein
MVPNDEVERRGASRRETKLIYPNHRLPPWLTEDATRDRSNRLLDDARAGSARPAAMQQAPLSSLKKRDAAKKRILAGCTNIQRV